VQAGLRAFVERLRADDQIALVTFSTEATTVESLRRRGDGRWLLDAIDRLKPGGNTNLYAGLMLGLDELARGDAGGMDRRVVLLTDGIANTGITAPDQIVRYATSRAEKAIDISTIGVGQNLDVPLLKRLADGCRGLFHFVADATDVQKVFVAEADALLAAVARNVRLTIELPGRDLDALQALHENVRREGDRLVLDLPDLNAGATGVVMVRCKLTGSESRDLEVRAEMAFTSASANKVQREVARAVLAPARLRDGGTPDHEVRKNAAIAVLAQGLADMAQSCDERRWADADRALQRATDDAKRLFPGNDDDVQRVRDITEGHSKTLRRYVDRFRDSER
jgi:Ca-activated chloride channel family protein